jgi:hypothetical protein
MSALLLPTRLLLARVGCSGPDTGESGRFLGVDPTTDAAPGQALAGVVRDGVDDEGALFGGINAEGQAGDTLAAASATLSVRVQAPDWIAPGVLRVLQDGEVLFEQTLPSDGGPLDFEASWTVAPDADAWLVVEVQGDASLGPAWRDAVPYAATNAFFLDVDGDGWTPPGL